MTKGEQNGKRRYAKKLREQALEPVTNPARCNSRFNYFEQGFSLLATFITE